MKGTSVTTSFPVDSLVGEAGGGGDGGAAGGVGEITTAFCCGVAVGTGGGVAVPVGTGDGARVGAGAVAKLLFTTGACTAAMFSSLVKYRKPPTPIAVRQTTVTATGHIQFGCPCPETLAGFLTCGVA